MDPVQAPRTHIVLVRVCAALRCLWELFEKGSILQAFSPLLHRHPPTPNPAPAASMCLKRREYPSKIS